MYLVPLAKISDNPYQTRRVYDDIPELARRIRSELVSHPETLGLLQVPMGRLVADDGEIVPLNGAGPDEVGELLTAGATVQLAFGHRRKRAFEWLSRHADLVPAGNGAGSEPEVATQLAAVQKLMSTLQAGDVKVQGKIRVDLSIEVDVGAAAK